MSDLRKSPELLDRLVLDLKPVRRIPRLGEVLPTVGIPALGAAMLLLAGVFHFRADLLSAGDHPFFLLSSAIWLISFFGVLRLTYLSAVPGGLGHRRSALGLVFFIILQFVCLAFAPGREFLEGLAVSGLGCSLSLTILSILPILILLVLTRRMAPLNPAHTLRLCVATGGAAGAFALAFHCGGENVGHLLAYHFGPILLLMAVLPYCFSRVLRW